MTANDPTLSESKSVVESTELIDDHVTAHVTEYRQVDYPVESVEVQVVEADGRQYVELVFSTACDDGTEPTKTRIYLPDDKARSLASVLLENVDPEPKDVQIEDGQDGYVELTKSD